MVGKGGSGLVYLGRLPNDEATEVAVKVLNDSSEKGTKELVAEVKTLLTVHHRALVSFVGFCEERPYMSILYEYMCNGNLSDLLAGKTRISELLTWKKRMEIALDVATGLQYLHSGCRPRIVHRDVKSRNILLNEQLEAKLADFGVCRSASIHEEITSTVTLVTGTPGYIDPGLYSATATSTGITPENDVYSYGVVLFELICGLPAIFDTNGSGRSHIVAWAVDKLMRRDVDGIIDPRIKGKMRMDSLWKVAEIAVACTKPRSKGRPDMNNVLQQLRDAMDAETLLDHEGFPPMAEEGLPIPFGDINTGTTLESMIQPAAR